MGRSYRIRCFRSVPCPGGPAIERRFVGSICAAPEPIQVGALSAPRATTPRWRSSKTGRASSAAKPSTGAHLILVRVEEAGVAALDLVRSEEHTSELQSR